ncbi:hypothetical protein [Streptomyces sp. F001]|uniref:hypothetical protein n=1 Tax=Streptomyces sp. F001 TaxID=1510026 RepID=UPI00101E7C40|nr:hypothetical protein [Streptomyces sp. F001]
MDGTRLDVADTPANRKAFGAPPRGRFGSGRYPQIRVLMLIASGTRAVLEAVWGPGRKSALPVSSAFGVCHTLGRLSVIRVKAGASLLTQGAQ